MKKNLVLFCLLVLLAVPLSAQLTTGSHTTSATAALYEGETLMIDYTIGELAAVTTIGGTQLTLTQGLHQPDKFTVGIADWNKPWNKLHAWPNPSSGTLFLETDGLDELSLTVFDAAGRLVKHQIAEAQKLISLNVETLSAGAYQLVVRTKDERRHLVIPFVRAFQ
ncbi:MAG: T9SS type A sorting domain-containing protein [Bacteroidia bacterium]|jgi:hypothetical protein|nr:T9SS type A sorting domain-containing protein [Bacteroidia bacterium]